VPVEYESRGRRDAWEPRADGGAESEAFLLSVGRVVSAAFVYST
jgi:hypothetical protein